VLLGDVVDEFHDDDSFADARATEQADFSALQEGLDEVNDLHAGLEHFSGRGLLIECRGQAVNGHPLVVGDGAEVVDRFADDVHHATQRSAADWNGNRAALIDGFHAAHHAVGGLHGDATHTAFSQVLLHFEDDIDGHRGVEALADDAERLIDGRHGRLDKLNVNGGARDLNYMSDIFWHKTSASSR
jgi:hypothetical protein